MEKEADPGTLAYWLKPFKNYFDRQGMLAREGLTQADQGARQVRGGDLGGLAGMFLGPLGYLSSPINALVPTESEVYNAPDLPESAKPLVAGGLGLAAMMLPGNKKGMGPPAAKAVQEAVPEGITAYHGSPHTFDKFDSSRIGTGEGAQSYGHGLYFADTEGTARHYRDALTSTSYKANVYVDGKAVPDKAVWYTAEQLGVTRDQAAALQRVAQQGGLNLKTKRDQAIAAQLGDDLMRRLKIEPREANPGSMYQVRLNVKPDELLDWDRPLSQQSEFMRGKVTGILGRTPPVDHPGGTLYNRMAEEFGGARGAPPPEMTERLKAAGIKGIRYKDAGTRNSAAIADASGTVSILRGAVKKHPSDATLAQRLTAAEKALADAEAGGTYNYVIFDDKLVDILKRYGIPITAGAGGAAIVLGQDMPDELAAQMGQES